MPMSGLLASAFATMHTLYILTEDRPMHQYAISIQYGQVMDPGQGSIYHCVISFKYEITATY